MSEESKQVSFRTTAGIVDRIDRLCSERAEAVRNAFPGASAATVRRSSILRLALSLGVQEIERRVDDPTRQ